MKETERSQNSSSIFYKFVILAIAALLVWSFVSKKAVKPVVPEPVIVQSNTQLSSSTPKYSGMGTAGKELVDNKNYTLNVTAFLDKPAAGFGYYVYLKGNGADLKDKLIGKMELAGDVFSLNYSSDSSAFSYKDVVVTRETEEQVKTGNIGTVVLTGTFDK